MGKGRGGYLSGLTKVLAEGIESEGELNYLAATGIEYFQGYYFAKPQLEHLTTFEALSFHARP